MQLRFLRIPEVKKLTGLSRSTIYADTTFPRAVKIGERAVGWVEHEVMDWIDARVSIRNEAPISFDRAGGKA